MPWVVPAHPAAVVSLKLWRPRAFSGLALSLGAVAPDLEFILRVQHDWVVSHTLAAQLYYTVPIVLLLHALITGVVLPWLLPLLPGGAPLFLHDLSALRPPGTRRNVITVASSGLVGGLSHVALDGFTHGNHSGWAVGWWPALAAPVPLPAGSVPLHDVLQVVVSIALSAAAWAIALRVGRTRLLTAWYGRAPAVREATAFEKRGAIAYVSACAAAGALTGACLPAATGRAGEMALYGLMAFVFHGVVIAAVFDRLRLRATRVPRAAAEAGA